MSFPSLELQLPRVFLADFLEATKTAQHRIWLQSMNYDPSPETFAIEKVLVDQAKNQIDIRINIDWVSERFYNHSFDSFPNFHFFSAKKRAEFNRERQASLQRIREAGGKVVITNRPSYLKSFFPIAGRNHIKMYVVDDTVWMGGVNLVQDGFSNVDGMIKIKDKRFLEAMTTQFFKVNEQRAEEHYSVELADELELLIDNGRMGHSLIYNQANDAVLNAHSEVQLYSQIMPTGKLLDSLVKKSKEGVRVIFTTSNEEDDVFVSFPEVLFFKQFLSKIRHNSNFSLKHLDQKLHLKLLLIDNEEFFFGSHNLSQVGVLLGTEEIMLHGKNEKLVQEFKQFYQ